MRPGDRAIRVELRREAAQLPIADDMWEKISDQLDMNQVRADRRNRLLLRSAQWKPALALAAAAGIFWLTVIPSGSRVDRGMASEPATNPAVTSTAWGQDSQSLRYYKQARRDMERSQPDDGQSTPERGFMVRSFRITAR